MPLYTQSIKNLKGGISQQPDILRFSDQGFAQVNAWSSESDGLQKRPPTVLTKRLGDKDYLGSNPKFHLINRDEKEQYYLVFTGDGIKVFELNGTERVVGGNIDYVRTASPREDIRVVTVADYTFVVNKTIPVRIGTTKAHDGYNTKARGIINLRGGQYGRTLSVSINGGTEVSYALPAGNDAENDPPKIDTQAYGEELRKLLVTAYPTYTFALGPNYLAVNAPDGVDINTITTKDGFGNTLINSVIDTVQTVSKLPIAAPDGYLVKIQGETGSSADEYWTIWQNDSKTWAETSAPNVVVDLNADTMPHAVVRQADGTFQLQTLDWAERGAGDDDTNPFPSFIDATINDVFFYRNRLGFLSGENIIMSRPAGYFRFFPKSVATLSDDDPIDVAVSNPRISILKYAIPFAEQLLLWSDEVQFVMTSAGAMTAKSIQLDAASAFNLSDAARPFAVGRSVFFSSPRGTFTSINRYFSVQDVSDVKDADDVTGHVLNYIQNGVFDIQGSSTESFLSVITTGYSSRVYIYKFLFKDSQQLQSSWSHWEFEPDVQVWAASVIGSTMHLALRTSSGITLETVKFTKESKDFDSEPHRLYMDSKVSYSIPSEAYDNYWGETTLTLSSVYGFTPSSGSYLFVDSSGAYVEVTEPEGGWKSDSKVVLNGDWTSKTLFIGRKFKFFYQFSRLLIKHEDQNGTVTEDTGRLQLRRAWVNFQSTGALRCIVGTTGQSFTNMLNGPVLGAGNIGTVPIGQGQFRFPMNGDARHTSLILESDYPTPVSIVGCGWEASYARKAKSI